MSQPDAQTSQIKKSLRNLFFYARGNENGKGKRKQQNLTENELKSVTRANNATATRRVLSIIVSDNVNG